MNQNITQTINATLAHHPAQHVLNLIHVLSVLISYATVAMTSTQLIVKDVMKAKYSMKMSNSAEIVLVLVKHVGG